MPTTEKQRPPATWNALESKAWMEGLTAAYEVTLPLVHELAFRLSLHGPGAAVQAMRMLEAAGVEPDHRLREAVGLPREGE